MRYERISFSMGLRWKRILAIFLLIVYLLVGQIMLSSAMVSKARDQSIARLQDVTAQFASSYYQNAMTDREQLRVVADMLSMHIKDGQHDLSAHLATFQCYGMIDRLQVLLPDGTLITGSGTADVADRLSYTDELAQAPCISPITNGLLDPSVSVIRSSVPIQQDGQTIAILYGVYDLSVQREPIIVDAFDGQSYPFVIEPSSGRFIIDGLHNRQTVGTTSSHYDPKPGTDFSVTQAQLSSGQEGYAAFHSLTLNDYMYICYTPIGINGWMAMVSVPEPIALAHARESQHTLSFFILFSGAGVAVYFIWWFLSDRKLRRKNLFVDTIQAQLMGVSREPQLFHQALRSVADRARCEAVFLLDDARPIPEAVVSRNPRLKADFTACQDGLTQELLALCNKTAKALQIKHSSALLQDKPCLIRLMNEHGLPNLLVVPVPAQDGSIRQLMGALAPANPDAQVLLSSVAVDFLMAASNMDHITRLETASTVDVLTGIMNRTSYHQRLEQLSSISLHRFGCVYIDVNDLHAINNRYGHDKGDAMLCAIADVLKNAFGRKNVYRFGGDEFVILVEDCGKDWLEAACRKADQEIRTHDYTVSIGSDWAESPTAVDAMIRQAERRMYKAKYQHYQTKEQHSAAPRLANKSVRNLRMAAEDMDAFLQVAQRHYHGACFVNLATDEVHEVLTAPAFASPDQTNTAPFSVAFQQYISEAVDKNSRRTVQTFFSYDQLRQELDAGKEPVVEFTKSTGDRLLLTVIPSPRYTPDNPETLWVFEPTS